MTGLSYTGSNCLLTTRVSGYSRVPAPPARRIPFTSMPSIDSPTRVQSLSRVGVVTGGDVSAWEYSASAEADCSGFGRNGGRANHPSRHGPPEDIPLKTSDRGAQQGGQRGRCPGLGLTRQRGQVAACNERATNP